MRFSSLVVALGVIVSLYLVIFEREALLAFAAGGAPDAEATAESGAVGSTDTAGNAVPVVVLKSQSRDIDQVVLLRGRTEAAREVEARAETAGRVISDPLRKGALVEAGDLLCRIDAGTRQVRLSESEARLAEARAGLPAAKARLAEAEAALPAAEAGIAEARARVPEAEARLAEARAGVPTAEARLVEALAGVPTAEARLAEAEALVPTAEARLAEARAGLPAAEARVAEARARIEEAEINLNAAEQLSEGGFASQIRLASARAELETAKANLQTSLSQLEGAKAAIQSAMGQVESAKAALQSAKGQVESARAAVQSAKGQVEGAHAAIESARAGVEAATAGIASARSGDQGAKAAVETARSGVESALAGIESAEAAVAAARREIDLLTITAPFAGLLETDTAELGALLQQGGLCATVIQLDPIKLVGFVPESQVDKVRLGATAGARLASGNREVLGKVTFIARSADTATRTFRIEIEVPNADQSIRDGQTAEIGIQADRQVAHLIPQSALTLDDEGVLGVRVVEPGNVVGFRQVSVLRDTPEGMFVAGLETEADVIVVGQEYVTEGVTVAPTYREAAE